MELGAYALRLAGIEAVDLVAELGSVLVPRDHGIGELGGLVAHLGVGVAWALFYAYFFWGRLKWPPVLQGLAFGAIPAILAVLFVYPQLKLMQAHGDIARVEWSDFAKLSVGALVSIVVMHALYGLVIGFLYTRPVGYRVGHSPGRLAKTREFDRSPDRGRLQPHEFMFATGIECSYPTIDQGRWRRD
jgi:hypothetical protein